MRGKLHGLRLLTGLGLAGLALSGCVSTAVAVVEAPFKVVGAGIDAVYTSQAERDEKRGRALRKEDERRGKELRKQQEAEAKAAKQVEKERRKAEKAARAG